jgi:hypothetical protein
MKRSQTENTAPRCLAAAVFAISLLVGWAFELRAESRTSAVGTLSPAALKRLGDTIRNEITCPYRKSNPLAVRSASSASFNSKSALARSGSANASCR